MLKLDHEHVPYVPAKKTVWDPRQRDMVANF